MILKENHPFLSLSAEISPLCTLLENFGIHHFTYLKQFINGSKISLSNKPQWISDYYNLKLYESSLFEKHTSPSINFQVWFGDYDLAVYKHGKENYNTMHSISITESRKESCENFLFATTPDNAKAIHFLNNNREILFHFILYLRDRGKKILELAHQHRLSAGRPLKLGTQEISDWLLRMQKLKKDFFTKTQLRRCILAQSEEIDVKLAKQEMDCLFYLLNNKTAAETAQQMKISRRTVEAYLENIKNKLVCSNKAEIISRFKDNPYFKAIR
jgi:DNA-binding CsgD family transcriptional regulator